MAASAGDFERVRMLMYAIAHGHRKRVCTGSWLWEKNPLPHLGFEPASVLRLAFQSDALPTELSLHYY